MTYVYWVILTTLELIVIEPGLVSETIISLNVYVTHSYFKWLENWPDTERVNNPIF